MTKRLLTVVLFCSLGLLAACGGKSPVDQLSDMATEPITETMSGDDAPTGASDAEPVGSSGEPIRIVADTSNGELHADFPFLIPQGAEITLNQREAQEHNTQFTFAFELRGEVDIQELIDFYWPQLEAIEGISSTSENLSESTLGQMATLYALSDDGKLGGTVQISKWFALDKTEVTIGWSVPTTQGAQGSSAGGPGGSSDSTAEIPEGFPLQVPPGAQITEGLKLSIDTVTTMSVEFKLASTLADLEAFYLSEFERIDLPVRLNWTEDHGDGVIQSIVANNDGETIVAAVGIKQRPGEEQITTTVVYTVRAE